MSERRGGTKFRNFDAFFQNRVSSIWELAIGQL